MSAEISAPEEGLARRTAASPAPQSAPAHTPAASANGASPSRRSLLPNPLNWRVRWLHSFLPFLKLREPTEEPFWRCCRLRQPKLAEAFVLSAGLWLVMVSLSTYMLFVISSCTFQVELYKGQIKTVQKEPRVGNHYLYVLIAKELAQVLLMHHLCGNLMEPLVEMREHHAADLDAMRPMGVVHWALRVWSRMRRREHSVRWFSTFIADHILLLGVGCLSLVHQVVILIIKIVLYRFAIVGFAFLPHIQQDVPLLVIHGVLSFYSSVLVMGFLVLTLEDSVVAKVGRRREYAGTMALFILLWASNFLTILFDRQIYTSAWTRPDVGTRILASAAMVFVTHSSVMMGAVLCGHSAHFKRCPDITWRVTWSRGIPLFLLTMLVVCLIGARRFTHSNESCRWTAYDWLAKPWPYVWTAWTSLGGGWLLWLALTDHGAEVHHGARSEEISDEESLMNVMDYDTMLITVTSSVAVLWNVAKVFEMEALGALVSEAAYILALLAPVGLAAFALVVWKRPPKSGSWRSWTLWFALFFTSTMFVDFQEKEDCEISSDLPSCCSYPWFPDYNAKADKKVQCNKPLRCNIEPDCRFHDEEDDDDEPDMQISQDGSWTAGALRAGRRLQASAAGLPGVRGVGPAGLHRGTKRPLGSAGAQHFSEEQCEVLSGRWNLFINNVSDDGYLQAMQDAAREAQEQSTAFRLFSTIGQAGCVEVYFTIFGVLLKVIFLTQHPNSEHILSLDSHHHQVDAHSGANRVVSVPGAARGWGSIRAAARLGLLRPGAAGRGAAGPSEAAGPQRAEAAGGATTALAAARGESAAAVEVSAAAEG